MSLPEMFRDPIWNFIAVVVGIVAILLTLLATFIQRQKKALSYEVLSVTPLLNISEKAESKLQVFYEGKIVLQPHLAVLKIQNSGNTSIIEADYAEPVEISFDQGLQLVAAEVINVDPVNLKPSIDVSNNKITLSPLLLNKGDCLEIKAITDKPFKVINVTGRIIGVKRITEFASMKRRYQYFTALGIGVMITGLILGAQNFIGLILILAGSTVGLYSLSRIQ